ncbi:MAG: mandelate racemase/muconate lactonizing enzyme family protein [Bacillota bacterium]
MKITDVKMYPVRVPLLYEFKAAYGIRNTADFVIVEIIDESGTSGWGEASTIPIYDEGSQADVVFVIENYFKPLLIGQNPTNISGIMYNLDKAVKGSRYAKCAIDFALHDLTGKLYGLPVYKLLGGKACDIKVCWVLGAKSSEDIKREATEKANEGYREFKLKVGRDAKQDLANLEALRKAVGDDISIRLDGNEAWRPKEAISLIEKFMEYNPDHVEQPVPASNLEGLKFVRSNVSVPIVADECILTPYDTMRVARMEACDRVNIKVSRAGGILPSVKIAAIAQAAAQMPFAGSNLELGIGTAASAHLFMALPGISIATELVGPLLLKEDILKEDLKYENGKLIIDEKPGIGVEPDMDLIEKYSYKR